MSLVALRRPGPRAWFAWSGGKNALYALDVVRRERTERVEGLLTWLDAQDRVVGSEVPRALLEEQARSVGLELRTLGAGEVGACLAELAGRGVAGLVFGDAEGASTLERHAELAREAGLEAVFPLAGRPAEALAGAIAASVRSVLTAVDARRAPRSWVGRTFGPALLEERPPEVHPTGARGEHHGFACGGPGLSRPISPRWVDLEHEGGWAYARLEPGPRRGYG